MARLASGDGPHGLLHPNFIGAGATLLMAACATDVMYLRTSIVQWASFSAWLISTGLVLALLAAAVLIIDLVTGRAGRISWARFLLVAAAALLSVLNVFVHSRDAWTSVVPQGIGLSAVVTILLLIAAVGGWRVTTEGRVATGDRT